MKNKLFKIAAILMVASLLLTACGEATMRPVVNVNASELFLEQPGFVDVTVSSSDNSFDKKPLHGSITLGETKTEEIDGNQWSGHIWVGETTTFTGSFTNEAGQTQDALTVTVANGESYSDDSSWDYADFATLQNACIATGGRQAWKGSALKNFEWKAIVSRVALENGFTLQPYFTEAAPSFRDILGYAVPADFEPMNDGIQTLTCFDAQGNPFTWVFDRIDATSVPFYHISAIRLNSDGSVTVWYNDNSGSGGWDGNGSDPHYTYARAQAFTSWNVLISTFSNEEEAMTRRVDETKELSSGIVRYNLPEFAEIVAFWK